MIVNNQPSLVIPYKEENSFFITKAGRKAISFYKNIFSHYNQLYNQKYI